jgi:hypothetical protein
MNSIRYAKILFATLVTINCFPKILRRISRLLSFDFFNHVLYIAKQVNTFPRLKSFVVLFCEIYIYIIEMHLL